MKYLISFFLILGPLTGWSQMSEISKANNQFAFDLFNAPSLKNESLFFSPFSLSAALSMTSAGAKEETLKQMQKVLHLPEKPHDGYREIFADLKTAQVELSIANQIWSEKSSVFFADFLAVLQLNYQASAQQVDFRQSPEASRVQINQWVSEQTKKKIPELLKKGDITADTDLVLTNAIYFKGKWQSAFDPKSTKKEDFLVSREIKKPVSFMHKTGQFEYAESEDFQMLAIPYQGEELSFVAVVPRGDKPLSKLNEEIFAGLSQRKARARIEVQVPKFKADRHMQMKDVLSELGMPLAFDEAKANFLGMRKLGPKEENLYLSKVVHQAVVEVNEEGTEASAATAVVAAVRMTSVPMKPIRVLLNRPFAYFITDKKSGAILFMGRYQGPNGVP